MHLGLTTRLQCPWRWRMVPALRTRAAPTDGILRQGPQTLAAPAGAPGRGLSALPRRQDSRAPPQNPRSAGRELWKSSGPPPPSGVAQSTLRRIAPSWVYEDLQRRRHHSLSGQCVPAPRHPHGTEMFPHILLELPLKGFPVPSVRWWMKELNKRGTPPPNQPSIHPAARSSIPKLHRKDFMGGRRLSGSLATISPRWSHAEHS